MIAGSGLTRIAGPAVEPVPYGEAAAHLRLTSDTESALVHGHIRAARMAVESWTGRALITQQWRLSLDAWPGPTGNMGLVRPAAGATPRHIVLPRPPLQSVTQVALYDDGDVQTLWPTSNYYVDSARVPGRLVLRDGAVPPRPGRAANAIEIDFTCGYGASPGEVPEPMRQAMLILIAHFHENRELVDNSGKTETVPMSVAGLLAPYRQLGV